MNLQQGIMSLARPRVSAQDSQAVDQILGNTTQMLGKLDNKTLGLLLQLTQYLKAHKSKYKELMANLEAKGSLPPGVFPDNYDPKFLSVFALSVAKAQQAKGGMAAGGIASIAQTMKDQGRGKDTMLAHISPEEAELLEKRGGVNTINPVTGLPEFGIFDDIGNALSGVGKAVGSVLKPVGDLIGGVLSSPLGLAATAAAAYYFMGPGAAVVPSVAEAALPGAAVAEIGTAAHLTPAAIESGIGSAGYGFNQSAAASGLFDPATIGSGAAIGAPSMSDKLLSSNLLKNIKLSSGEEEPASDPNALIKMLMMFEMMNNKQNQPGNAVVPALAENTSNLPYDAPKKPTYPQTRAAEGGLMTKHLGIGGLSANRTQTDYAKNYLRGSGYRPGQGGITYFTPMKYGPNVPEPSLPVEPTPTPTPTPVDDLVKQTVGKPGGGGMDSESRAAMLADTAKRMDAWEASDLEGYKNRNNWIGQIFDGSLLSGLAKLAAQGIDKVKQTWADNRLKALGIDPKIAIANQNQLSGLSMQQALNSLGQASAAAGNYAEVGGYEPGSQEAKAAASGTVGGYGPGTAGFNLSTTPGAANQIAGTDMQRALDSIEGGINPNVVSGSDMQRALDLNKVAPSAYPFQPNAVNNLLSSLGLPAESNATVESYLAANQNIAPTYTTDNVINQLAESIPIGGQIDYNPAERQATTDAANAAYQKALTDAAQAAAEARFQSLANETDAEREQRINFTPYLDVPQAVETLSPEEKMKAYNDAVDARLTQEKIDREAAARSLIENSPMLSEQEARAQKMLGQTPDESFKSYFGYEPDLGSLDSNQLKETFPGAFNPFEAYFAVTVYGPDGTEYGSPAQAMAAGVTNYSMSPPADPSARTYYDNSLAGDKGFAATGGFGNSWRSADGTPIRTADGFALQTGQGSQQQSLNDKVNQTVKNAQIAAGEYTGFSGPVFGPAPAPAPAPQPMMTVTERFTPDENNNEPPGGTAGWDRVKIGRDDYAYTRQREVPAETRTNEETGQPYTVPVGYTGSGRGDMSGAFVGSGAERGSSTRADPGANNAVNPGWGSRDAGGGYARGGYLQHGRFDQRMAHGGIANLQYNLGSYSDGGRLLKGPGDGVSDDIPATIGHGQPARLANGEFVIPARIVSELGNGSTDAGAKRLYEMMDRIQRVRRKTKNVAANTKAAKYLPA